MAGITLTRIVMKERPSVDFTACATFEDLDGRTLSVAFDGRHSSTNFGTMGTIYTYGGYTDCQVIDEKGKQHQMVSDITAMRAMRDALNRMNLDD